MYQRQGDLKVHGHLKWGRQGHDEAGRAETSFYRSNWDGDIKTTTTTNKPCFVNHGLGLALLGGEIELKGRKFNTVYPV